MTKEEILEQFDKIEDYHVGAGYTIEDCKIAMQEYAYQQTKEIQERVEELENSLEINNKLREEDTNDFVKALNDVDEKNKQLQAKINELEKANEWISADELNPEYYEKVLIKCSENFVNDNYSYYDVGAFTRDGWIGHLYKKPQVISWKKITTNK